MLPPSYFDNCAEDLIALYNKLDDEIIADISQRLVKYGGVTGASEWQILMAKEQGLLYDDIIDKVASVTTFSNAKVKSLFEDAGLEAVSWDNEIYEAAGLTGLPIKKSPAALQVLLAGMKKTNGIIQNLTLTTALQAQRTYIEAATFAEMQIESGAFSYATAIRNAIKRAAKEGATVQYPSGHIDKLDVAIRRAALTGVSQTAANISIGYAKGIGSDLVETTAHQGARPEHVAWQGKVFSLSGTHARYAPFTLTGYGTGEGLCGWNCRHSFYPWFEGLSANAYPKNKLLLHETQTVEYNGNTLSYYDATQKQRKYEREIRATRRELVGLDSGIKGASGNLRNELQNDFDNISVKLKSQEAKLKDFVSQTGLQKNSSRYQALGFGRSVSQKAVQANKKVANAVGSGYNKTIDKGKQEKHILGTNNYTDGRSFLSIAKDQTQSVINKYGGTGIKIGKNKEKIVADSIIGVNVNPIKSHKTLTDSAIIHYAKNGTHIVPTVNVLQKQSIEQLKGTAKKVALEYYDTQTYLKSFANGISLLPEEKEMRINALLMGKHSKTSLIKDIKSMERKLLRERGLIK